MQPSNDDDDDDDGPPAGANAKPRHFPSAPRPIGLGPHGSPMAFESRRVVRLHEASAAELGSGVLGNGGAVVAEAARNYLQNTEYGGGIRIRVPRDPEARRS